MRKMLGKYVYTWKILSLVGLLPISSSPTQYSPGSLCFPHDQNNQLGSMSWVEMKALHPLPLRQSSRGTHTERVFRTPGSRTRKALLSLGSHLFTPWGAQTRMKGFYLKDLWSTRVCAGATARQGSSRKAPSFLSAPIGSMTTPICEWLAGIKRWQIT